MLAAARVDGVLIRVASAYRSYAEQANLHESYVAAVGIEAAGELSAQAGHSEHQTGLAVDIADSSGVCSLGDCFADTPAGVWSAANAWKFGFLVRYPAGGRAITGYTYEPWHLRHVGTSVSATMHHQGIATLEEFLDQATDPAADISGVGPSEEQG
jgi:D-alanyl-D-alanine carboxypeptidase